MEYFGQETLDEMALNQKVMKFMADNAVNEAQDAAAPAEETTAAEGTAAAEETTAAEETAAAEETTAPAETTAAETTAAQ